MTVDELGRHGKRQRNPDMMQDPRNPAHTRSAAAHAGTEARLSLALDHIASLQEALDEALAQSKDVRQTTLRQAFEDQAARLQAQTADQDRALHAAALEAALLKTQLVADIAALEAQTRAAAIDHAKRQQLQTALTEALRSAEAATDTVRKLAAEVSLLRAQLSADAAALAQEIETGATERAAMQTLLAEANRQVLAWQDEAERQKKRRAKAETRCEQLQSALATQRASPPSRLRKLLGKPAD